MGFQRRHSAGSNLELQTDHPQSFGNRLIWKKALSYLLSVSVKANYEMKCGDAEFAWMGA